MPRNVACGQADGGHRAISSQSNGSIGICTDPFGTCSLRWAEGRAMSEANKELVRWYFEEIFNRKNLAVCDELMAEDFFEHAAAPFASTAPGRVNGPAAMRATAEW